MPTIFTPGAVSVAAVERHIRHARHARIIWPPQVPPVVEPVVIALVSLGFMALALWGYLVETRDHQKREAESDVAVDNRRRQPPRAA